MAQIDTGSSDLGRGGEGRIISGHFSASSVGQVDIILLRQTTFFCHTLLKVVDPQRKSEQL